MNTASPNPSEAVPVTPGAEQNEIQPKNSASADVDSQQTTPDPAIVTVYPFPDEGDVTDVQSEQEGKRDGGEANAQENAATVCIAFKDFGFESIEGLKYKLKVDGKFTSGMTDATGSAVTLTDLMPGSDVEIFVFREHANDFKNIGKVRAFPGCTGYSIVSPKLKFNATTELHSGAPGDAENDLPPVPSNSNADKPEDERLALAGTTMSSNTTNKTNGLPSTPTSTSSSSAAPLQSAVNNKKSTSSLQKNEKIASGRDARGHPQATAQDSTLDWLKRKILSVFNHWSWHDFQTHASQPASQSPAGALTTKAASSKGRQTQAEQASLPQTPTQAAQGHPKVNPLSPPASTTPGKKLSEADLSRLQALIDFTEKQAEFDYSPYKGKGGTTVNVLNEYAKKEVPSFGTKKANTPLGLCQVYVKIALFKAGYTNGPGWEGQAKTSGKDWLKYGFTDISNLLPQVEITYENILAPADWPQAELCLKKKAALKKLQEERKKQKQPLTSEEITAAEKNIPAMPEKKKEVKYTQPDLMYTLPGDVIVYEQVDPVELDPAGHVDIRTYHGFMSDFAWSLIPSLGGPAKTSKRFRVTGVYRKITDTKAIARVMAFLRILRDHEAKGFKDPYRALRYDPFAKPSHITFEDFSAHPYAKEKKNKPAGAYQIKLETWEEVTKKMTGWPTNFTPATQDRIAIFLLQRRPYINMTHPRHSALGYIMEGRIEDAINKASLWNEWSCLPGGGRESQMDMDELKILFSQYEQEYSK